MSKKIVLAGGGHAHMMALANLHQLSEKGHQVTVIGPSDYHYYSGMGPGMLGKTYTPEEIRFNTKHVAEKKGGTFVRGKVARIDGKAQQIYLASGKTVPYDILSCNLGSDIESAMTGDDLTDIYFVKPIERLIDAQKRILEIASEKDIKVAVVGGGPSAVEVAGNVWRLLQDSRRHAAEIKILTRTALMPRHPNAIARSAQKSLIKRGIEIIENCRVHQISPRQITDNAGKSIHADIIFVATGVKPTPVFAHSGLATGPDGGLAVNRFLQSVEYENILGGGDCIHFQEMPLDKVGVYAVRQNPVLLNNIIALLDGRSLQPFNPGGKYLLIFNLGDGTGILHKWSMQFGGRTAFFIKDYIDRKFMKKFQQIEQLDSTE